MEGTREWKHPGANCNTPTLAATATATLMETKLDGIQVKTIVHRNRQECRSMQGRETEHQGKVLPVAMHLRRSGAGNGRSRYCSGAA